MTVEFSACFSWLPYPIFLVLIQRIRLSFIPCMFKPCGRGYKNSTTVIPAVHKMQQKGQSEGSEKPLLFILSYKRQDAEEEGRVMSPQTLVCLVLATSL